MLLWEAVGGKKVPKKGVHTVAQPISTRLRSMQSTDRCEAMTRSGRRCRCRKAADSQFCNFHDPEISARIREAARQKREERKQQMAALPTEYTKSLASVDGITQALDCLFREVRLGVVSPRTAGMMLSIIDRVLVHDKLVREHGPRRVSKRVRALEVREQLAGVLEELQLPAPPRPAKGVTVSGTQPTNQIVRQP